MTHEQNSLYSKLERHIRALGKISYGDMCQFCVEEGYKVSNGERRLRENENIKPVMGKSMRKTEFIVGYRWNNAAEKFRSVPPSKEVYRPEVLAAREKNKERIL